MPAFPGTVRVAGTLSAADGAVIVNEDRLSLQAGEDNLGNWSLDTLDVAVKGQAITIAIDNEVVVFVTDNADELVEAVEEGAKRAAETAALRNDRIKRTRRPRIGRKATTKRKIELFDEHQRTSEAPQVSEPTGIVIEPGADPWGQGTPDLWQEPPHDPWMAIGDTDPVTIHNVLAEELSALTQPEPETTPTPPPVPIAVVEPPRNVVDEPPDIIDEPPAIIDEVLEEEREHEEAPESEPASRIRIGTPRMRPSMLVAVAAVAAIVGLGLFFTQAVSIVTLGVAAVAIMVAIAGLMDQTIEVRLPKQLSVIRLFGLGLALLAAGTALNALI